MVDPFPVQAESDLTYWVDQKNGDRMIKQSILLLFFDKRIRSPYFARHIDRNNNL